VPRNRSNDYQRHAEHLTTKKKEREKRTLALFRFYFLLFKEKNFFYKVRKKNKTEKET